MTSQRYLSGGLLIWLWLVTTLLPSLPANAATFATQDVMIPFAQKDGNVLQLDTMVLIPEGHRRFPLAVVSHGSPRHAYQRAYMRPTYFADMGQWLVNLGFVVAIPMRRGYGKSQGAFAEGFGSCAYPDYADAGRASAKDIEAVVTYMDHQTYVDANRIVLIGHSAGGWGSLALASEGPTGTGRGRVVRTRTGFSVAWRGLRPQRPGHRGGSVRKDDSRADTVDLLGE